ncbi:MAG: hypothetical protein KJO15_08705, partial [Alphaproteobacteria bacterium]|nr:hypothetical protein [Alphaproteobacteria bacterium]
MNSPFSFAPFCGAVAIRLGISAPKSRGQAAKYCGLLAQSVIFPTLVITVPFAVITPRRLYQ